ncbi:MAG: AEC family transporter [Pseudobdellovibrio sp.]
MSNFVIIFFSFLFGLASKHIKKFPPSTGISLNLFIIYVSLPALILARLPQLLTKLDFHGYWWAPVATAWLSFLIAYVLITLIAKKYNWSSAKTGALILTVGLGNTSFVGFPLLDALIGKEAIEIGILADQPGSFLILSTLGIFIAARYSGGNSSLKYMLPKVFLFPPFIAMLGAIVWSISGITMPLIIFEALDKIALTLVPLALFSVGFQTQFDFKIIAKRLKPLYFGLTLKLFFIPLIFYIFFYYILKINNLYIQVSVLEAAMATQITSAVVATEFNLDSELANLMVGLSIPLSLISVPLWYYFIS